MGNCTKVQKSTYNIKKRGGIPKKKLDSITVATLNYSSILRSPFEFFSNDLFDIELKLSQKFRKLANNYITEKFESLSKWPLGSIDKIFQDRYSPLYQKECGISNDGLLENSYEFTEKWMKKYKSTNTQNQNWTEEEIQTAIIFDLICYHSIITHIFEFPSTNPKQIDRFIDDQLNIDSARMYAKFMGDFFSKPFLNQNLKIHKTLRAMSRFDIDVLFLQEADKNLLYSIQNYYPDVRICQSSDPKCDSAIIINQRTFPGLLDLRYENRVLVTNQAKINTKEDRKKAVALTNQDFQALNLNNKTVVQVVENFILISSHLTSKKKSNKGEQVNEEQIKKLINILTKIKEVFSQYHIVCGMDLNSSLKPELIPLYHIFPTEQDQFTVNKIRTYLQPQISKAEKFFDGKEARDFLISNSKIHNAQITTIEGSPTSSVNSLPCSEHPYDHFLVMGKIKRKVIEEEGQINGENMRFNQQDY